MVRLEPRKAIDGQPLSSRVNPINRFTSRYRDLDRSWVVSVRRAGHADSLSRALELVVRDHDTFRGPGNRSGEHCDIAVTG